VTRRVWISLAAAAVMATVAAASGSPPVRTVHVVMRYSRFVPSTIAVPAGTTVRFVLENHDPIPHEFILGSAADQLRHERGAPRSHDGLPGQASLAVGETQTLLVTFLRRGIVLMGCHRPGHDHFGMRGVALVT
jgi:uncharacterized cupredoxin-like copper-binding protein